MSEVNYEPVGEGIGKLVVGDTEPTQYDNARVMLARDADGNIVEIWFLKTA